MAFSDSASRPGDPLCLSLMYFYSGQLMLCMANY